MKIDFHVATDQAGLTRQIVDRTLKDFIAGAFYNAVPMAPGSLVESEVTHVTLILKPSTPGIDVCDLISTLNKMAINWT